MFFWDLAAFSDQHQFLHILFSFPFSLLNVVTGKHSVFSGEHITIVYECVVKRTGELVCTC